ncbi:MAG: sensor histidine kinase [Pseudomonadota bacterium]
MQSAFSFHAPLTEHLLDTLPLGLLVVNSDLRILKANATLIRELHLENTDWQNQPLMTILPVPALAAKCMEAFDKASPLPLKVNILSKRLAIWAGATTYAEEKAFLLLVAEEYCGQPADTADFNPSDQLLPLLVDSVQDYAIVMLDPVGRVAIWNKGAERIFGYQEAGMVGRSFSCLFTPEDIQQGVPEKELEIAQEKGSAPDNRWLVRKDGSRFFATGAISPIRDGASGLRGFAKVVHDTTHQKQAEDALRVSEERFRLLVENARDYAIFLIDMEGRINSWNAGAQRILGYAEEEITGRNFNCIFTPEDIQGGKPALELSTASKEGRALDNRWHVRKDGSRFWASGILTGVYDEAGNLRYFAKIMRDITEQKLAEEEIQRLNMRLAQQLGELQVVNNELETFSYSVSHDLQAPLRAIDGFSAVLLEECGDDLSQTCRQSLDRIRAASRRMRQLTDDLLALAQVARGEMHWQPVDLGGIARQIADQLLAMQPKRQVEFVIQSGVTACGDPRLLQIALENLLGNAWKFTGKRPAARIEFGRQEEDGELVYFVRDDGAGFDMSYAHKLFGAFQRLHGATEFEGTGIGLATVARIIHRHGGRIWAEGAPGQGAVFYFTLGGTGS